MHRDITGGAERSRRECALMHPAALVTAFVLGVALVAAPVVWFAGRGKAPKSAPPVAASAPAKVAPADPEPVAAAVTPPGQPAPRAAHKTRLIAFYANWGEEGRRSLARNAADIDTLMPMWFHLGNNGKLTFDKPEESMQIVRLAKSLNPDMKIIPIVNNYNKPTESWNPEEVSKMLRNPAKRKAIAADIVRTLDSRGFDGVNIDFESFTEKDRAVLVAFMADLYPLAQEAGLEVSMDVIVGSKTYDHSRLSQNVDYLIPMMYDEHWKTSPAGPISSIPWFDRTLDKFLTQVPAEKVVVGVGTYAYDWGGAGQRAKSLDYKKALGVARARGATIGMDPRQLNSRFAYREGKQVRQVWILDALSAFNQVQVAQRHKVKGYALWRLGAEDPSLWQVLPRRDTLGPDVAQSLNTAGRRVTYDESRGLITASQLKP